MNRPEAAFQPENRRFAFLRALGGGFEVVAVIGASTLAAVLAQQFITPSLGEALGLEGAEPDLMAGSWTILRMFALQYGVLLGLALVFGLLRGRRSARSYALGKGSLSTAGILKWGIALGLIAGAPGTLVLFLQEVAPIGQDTPIWAALREAPHDTSYWIFLFVGSFGLVPIVEELTWRSYAIGRLTETLAPGAAILFTALPFALLHVQYASTDPAMIATGLSVIIASFAFAFATVRTGTVWPAVIGHAITNFPADAWLGGLQLALALVLFIVFFKPIRRELGQWSGLFFRWSTLQALAILAPVIALAVLAMMFQAYAIWIGAAVLVAALLLGLAWRSRWRQSKT
ncbi:type II CAAX endopeptidase family protein [Hyphobacterium sp. HN65]|uniref:Type II CAAX endopeptidase family protein n=1 Tax=Hyphobacterium lacteum TaxID=3116575 RepID=A0ABU7LSQ5_9PROT|nr:type II CAAX endopeptidase family protein [Hyphobacterium sp. HN65]MEE2526952.1 type II CAAX endopeptidase family protein [Hyphobacterium sp. HN65]